MSNGTYRKVDGLIKTNTDMKTKHLAVYVIGGLLLVALIFWGRAAGENDNGDSPYSASVLVSTETDFDFGTIPMYGGDVVHEFTAINDGTEPIVVGKVYTTCGCTTAILVDASGKEYGEFGMQGHGLPSDTKVEVGPGEPLLVRAIFDPAAHGPSGVGLADRSVYVETNSAKSPKLEFSFKALVTQ